MVLRVVVLQTLFDGMDQDGTGEIDVQEFVSTLTEHAAAYK